MKILFLHLRDLHLDGITSEKIQAATDSLSIFSAFEGVVIIISGDIAASGKQNQYESAATLIGRLTSNIKSKYSISDKDFKLLLVPSNHDINYGANLVYLQRQYAPLPLKIKCMNSILNLSVWLTVSAF